MRNARNTLEEARKWGRVDDGGGGGGGGGAGGGGVRDVRVVRANATVVRVARPEWDESDGEQVISREMCIGRIWPRDSFFFLSSSSFFSSSSLSFFFSFSVSLSLSLLFPCPSKPKLLLHVRRSFRHAFRLSYRENIPIGRTSNKRVLSSPRIYSRIYFTVIEGIQSSSARRSDAWVGRVSSLPREIRRPIDIRPT